VNIAAPFLRTGTHVPIQRRDYARSRPSRRPALRAFNTSPAWLRTNTEVMLDGSRKARAALRNTAQWGLGMCLVFGYFVFVYRMFRGKVRPEQGA
jgi:hypothetical protein